MKICPVLHVSLLKNAANDPLPGQHIVPPTSVIFDSKETLEIEEIFNSRLYYRRGQYKVKSIGFEEPSW